LKGHAPYCVLCFRYVVYILVIDHDSVASYIFRVTVKLFCTCTHVYTKMLLLMMLRTMNSWEYERPQNFRGQLNVIMSWMMKLKFGVP